MSDQIHCFAEIPATISVGFALQVLKGGSVRAFFKKCTKWRAFFSKDSERQPHLWSPGKFFRSVCSVTAEIIGEYIKHSEKEWNFDFKDLKQKRLQEF